MGVYLLLRQLGASREEQTAGLIHDIAHTAFSHVIDYVFNDGVAQTVHEQFHTTVIFNSGIPAILKRYELDVERVTKVHHFGILERALPDLCADRVDYFLRDSLLLEKCSGEEVRRILGALKVYEQELMLTDKDTAEMMEERFRRMCLDFWGPPIQTGSYTLMGNILREALDKNIIDETDFFSTDEKVLKKLHDSLDTNIVHQMQLFSTDKIVEGTAEEHTFHNRSKARYINPKVLVEGNIIRTTDFVPGLQDKLEEFIEKYKKGYYITIRE